MQVKQVKEKQLIFAVVIYKLDFLNWFISANFLVWDRMSGAFHNIIVSALCDLENYNIFKMPKIRANSCKDGAETLTMFYFLKYNAST